MLLSRPTHHLPISPEVQTYMMLFVLTVKMKPNSNSTESNQDGKDGSEVVEISLVPLHTIFT